MKLKLMTTAEQSAAIESVQDGVALAADVTAAYEGLMACCAELDQLDACMESIKTCMDYLKREGDNAVAAVNVDGGLEELFEGINPEKITAEMALEGLGEKAQQAWDWFAKKVREFWAWIKSFFTKKGQALEETAKALKEECAKAEETSAKVEKEPEVKKVVEKAKNVLLIEFKKVEPDATEESIPALAPCGKLDDLGTIVTVCQSDLTELGSTAVNDLCWAATANGESGFSKVQGTIKSFCDKATADYKAVASTVGNKGCSVQEDSFKAFWGNGAEIKYTILTVSDYDQFLPARVDSNFIKLGYTKEGLAALRKLSEMISKDATAATNFAKSVDKIINNWDSQVKGADAMKQDRLRHAVAYSRIISKQAANSSAITQRVANYIAANLRDYGKIAKIGGKIAASAGKGGVISGSVGGEQRMAARMR